MEERIKGFFRKEEIVIDGIVVEVNPEDKREPPLRSFSRENIEQGSNLSMNPFAFQPVNRTYCRVETSEGSYVFKGDHHVYKGEPVQVRKTTLWQIYKKEIRKEILKDSEQ